MVNRYVYYVVELFSSRCMLLFMVVMLVFILMMLVSVISVINVYVSYGD